MDNYLSGGRWCFDIKTFQRCSNVVNGRSLRLCHSMRIPTKWKNAFHMEGDSILTVPTNRTKIHLGEGKAALRVPTGNAKKSFWVGHDGSALKITGSLPRTPVIQ